MASNLEGCSDAYIESINVEEVSVGTEDIIEDYELELFPNPTTNSVTLDYNFSNYQSINIQLTDLLGREMTKINLGIQQSGQMLIDLKNYSNGVYYLVCHLNDQKIVKKIIKIE